MSVSFLRIDDRIDVYKRQIMNGDLDELIDSLTAADQAAKLSNMEEE